MFAVHDRQNDTETDLYKAKLIIIQKKRNNCIQNDDEIFFKMIVLHNQFCPPQANGNT